MKPSPAPPLILKEFQRLTELGPSDIERLNCFAEMLIEWQNRINLVSTSSLKDMWRRHMLDSVQLKKFIRPSDKTILDLGSGAGFPGLVLGIVTTRPIHLVESNNRKCTFLREVARKTDANVVIHHGRIEDLKSFPVDVITARALASIDKLLDYSQPFLAENSRCLFLKGQNSHQELTAARKKWKMIVTEAESLSDASGTIFSIEGISRHHA